MAYTREMLQYALPSVSMPYSPGQEAMNEYFSRGAALGKTYSDREITSALGGLRGAELENQYRSWVANKQYLEHAREFNLNFLEEQRHFDIMQQERQKDRDARKWGGIASTALGAAGIAAGIYTANPALIMGGAGAFKGGGGIGMFGGGAVNAPWGGGGMSPPPAWTPSPDYGYGSYNLTNPYDMPFDPYGSQNYWSNDVYGSYYMPPGGYYTNPTSGVPGGSTLWGT